MRILSYTIFFKILFQDTTIGTVVFSNVSVTDDDADGSDAVDGPILFSLLDSLEVISQGVSYT